jgi:hypothetical protein
LIANTFLAIFKEQDATDSHDDPCSQSKSLYAAFPPGFSNRNGKEREGKSGAKGKKKTRLTMSQPDRASIEANAGSTRCLSVTSSTKMMSTEMKWRGDKEPNGGGLGPGDGTDSDMLQDIQHFGSWANVPQCLSGDLEITEE